MSAVKAGPMNGKRVLVVDDNLVDARALSSKLRSEGYEVVLAQDGAAAVSTARKQKLDLIFLDVLFPPDVGHGGGVPWDGFLILNWIRRLDEAKHVPIIFVTKADPKKYRDRAMKEGAAYFFSKPVKADELIAAVKAVLGQAGPQPAIPSKKTVLFVDDEGDWRLVAGECLRDAGFNILTAKDEAEALRRMETVKLDAIILDLNLAGQNGLLLMELLKQRHPGVPVLIYTGMDHDNSAITEMLKSGAKKYLRKGSMAELCDTLKAMVN
jgi:twitching motility two-component system response regulator PilH